MLKTCNVCNIEKPLSEFNSNGYQPSGNKKYKAKCNPVSKLMIGQNLEIHYGFYPKYLLK